MSKLHYMARLLCNDPILQISEDSGVLRVRVQKAQLVLAIATVPMAIAAALALGPVFRLPAFAITPIAVAFEALALRTLVGQDELIMDGKVLTLRKAVFGIGITRHFTLDGVRRFQYIDTLKFENGLRCLYFESEYLPYYFAHGLAPTAAAAVINAIAHVAPSTV